MSSYASGSIRVPGLSGNDTDFVGMIKKLRDIESRQVNQLIRWKKDWQTRLDAFKELRGELMSLQTTLNGLNSMNSFLAKSTVSSDAKVATAVADADSVNSSYKINVKQLASNCTWTKALPIYDKKDVIATDTGTFEYTYKGKTRTVNIPKNTTVEGFVKLINNDSKNPGVRAQLIQGADGLTFQLRGMDTGKSNTLVINKTTNIIGLDVNPTGGSYKEEGNKVTQLAGVASLTDSINDTGSSKTFVYTVDGTRRTVAVENGETLQDLVDKINTLTPGLANIVQNSSSEYCLALEKPDTTFSTQADPADTSVPPKYDLVMGTEFGADTEKVNPGGPAFNFDFEVVSSDGTTKQHSIEVDDEMTLRELMNAIQGKIGKGGKVTLVENAGKYKIDIQMEPKEHRVTVEDGTLDGFSYVQPTDPTWDISLAKNAQVKINGFPSAADEWLEVASNTLKSNEVMPGITFNLHSTGDADISVSTDTDKIKENIETYVDAVNSFRTKLMELTKYDESKEVLDPDYAESQFEMQKGGVLQGNYGVQLVATRLKNAVAGNALGFNKRMLDIDGSSLGGDIFTTLSQIGITTNANTGEANYGLLEINFIPNSKGSKSLEQALEEDPEAVARLFAVTNVGESNSDKFHYDSHLHNITKPGSYNVNYEIGVGGEIINASVGGQAVSIDQDAGTITVTGDGPAKGLVINVADRTDGLVVKDETVSIKSGKVQEVLGLLEGSEGILGSNGTLRNLERNYQGIIDNIDGKIKKEDDRITRWERTMILKFARLEGVLANYGAIQQNLESQLAQLGGNSK